jgi:hypothetical protein
MLVRDFVIRSDIWIPLSDFTFFTQCVSVDRVSLQEVLVGISYLLKSVLLGVIGEGAPTRNPTVSGNCNEYSVHTDLSHFSQFSLISCQSSNLFFLSGEYVHFVILYIPSNFISKHGQYEEVAQYGSALMS